MIRHLPSSLLRSRVIRSARGHARDAGGVALAVMATVAAASILLVLLGVSPSRAFVAIAEGAAGTKFNLGQTIMIASMLILTGLAAAIPFSARLWNIGGEGQMYFGAFSAAAIGLTMPSSVPHWLGASLAVVSALGAGAAWGLVPGLLKVAVGANEVIVSLMMVFIAILLANYAIASLWPRGFGAQTATVEPNTMLPRVWPGTTINLGAALAVIAAVSGWVLMKRTRLGFHIRATGANASAARLGGVPVDRLTVVAFLLGGAAAGLAGAIAVLGTHGALILNFSANYGFVGIAVALVAKLNPLGTIPVAATFSALVVGSNRLQVETGLSPSMGAIFVAVFVILLLSFRVLRLPHTET